MSDFVLPAPVVPSPWKSLSDYYAARTASYGPQQAQAGIGLTQAQTGEAGARSGLIGQQAQAAQIQNQLIRAKLGMLQAPAGSGPYDPNNLPWDQRAAAAGAQPQAGGIGGMVSAAAGPGAQSRSPGIGGAGSAAPAGSSIAGIGGAPSAAPGGIANTGQSAGSYDPDQTTGGGGVVLPGVGATSSLYAIAGVQDPKALTDWKALRSAQLQTLFQEATNPDGTVNADRWNHNVWEANNRSLITDAQAKYFHDNPGQHAVISQAQLSPEQNAQIQGQKAGTVAGAEVGPALTKVAGTAAIEGQYKMTEVKVPDAFDASGVPTSWHLQQVQTSQLPAFMQATPGAKPASAVDNANPNVTLSGAAFVGRLAQVESGGNYATANRSGPGGTPTTTAGGGLQFRASTWTDLLKAQRPDLVQGKTDAQIGAMRFDASPAGQALQNQMGVAYAAQNSAALKQAGMPVNSLTLGVAHQFGATGAQAVMNAPPATPISAPLVGRAAFVANPQWQGKTVADVMGNAYRSYGQNPVDLSQPAGALASAPGAGGAGGIPGPQTLSPTAEGGYKLDKEKATTDGKYAGDMADTAAAASTSQQQVLITRDLAAHGGPNGSPLPTGAAAAFKANLENYAKSLAPEWGQKLLAAITPIDPNQAGAFQELVKQNLLSAGQTESKTVGMRGSLGLTRLFVNSLPGVGTQPEALQNMMNMFLVQQQYTADHAQAVQDTYNKNYGDFRADPLGNQRGTTTPYVPLTTFDQQYYDPKGVHTPGTYFAAYKLMNGKTPADATAALRGLSEPQIRQAATIVHSIDPNARLP